MVTMYVTQPKREIYNAPYSGADKKEVLLKIIDNYAPRAYEIAKIKKDMTYEEIEDKLADDYLADYDAPYFSEYFEVSMRINGSMRKLF